MSARGHPQTFDQPRPASRPRLNPFSFPSNTDFFFILLVFAFLSASLEYNNMLYLWNGFTGPQYLLQTSACLGNLGILGEPDETGLSGNNRSQENFKCIALYERQRAAWMLAGLLPELALAGLIYWFFPAWITRRGHLSRLTHDEFPDLVIAVGELSREIGLKRLPDLYWNPMDLASRGMAFGRTGRYAVKLSGGLVSQFYTASDRFKAVMLHELAHIRSNDVDKTFLTMAIWMAFLVATLVIFVTILLGSSYNLFIDVAWRFGLLALLVYLIRNMVLRSREHYADLRAYQSTTVRSSLRTLIAQLSPPRQLAPFRRLSDLLSVHPHPKERLGILEDPLLLFNQGLLATLATGLVAGISYEPLIAFLSATTIVNLTEPAFLTGFVIGPVVMAIIGVGVWRSAFARLFVPGFPLRAGTIAFVLALGTFIGREVSYKNLDIYTSRTVTLISIPLWTIFVGLGLAVFFWWVQQSASGWLRVALQQPVYRPYFYGPVGLAAFVLSAWFGLTFFIVSSVDLMASSLADIPTIFFPIGKTILSSPLTLFVLMILWALPLGGALAAQRRPSGAAGWAFLELAPAESLPAMVAPPAPIRLRSVLIPALFLAIIYSVLVMFARAAVPVLLPELARNPENLSNFLGNFYWVLSILFQVAAAVWVTARSVHHRVEAGLLAAFASGLLMVSGLLFRLLLLDGALDEAFAVFLFTYFVNSGCLAALPVAGMVNWLVKLNRVKKLPLEMAVSSEIPGR